MSLPKFCRPTTVVKLVSNGKSVEVQAHTMKDEQTLSIAKESNKAHEILNAIGNLVQSCVIKPKNLDIRTLPIFDVVKLFITIRSMSKGTNMQLYYKCTNCDMKNIETMVDLSNIEYSKPQKPELIKVTPSMAIMPRYPSFGQSIELARVLDETEGKETVEQNLRLYASCIDKVYHEDEVTDTKDLSPDEVYDWFIELPEKVLTDMEKYIVSGPKTTLKVDVVCPKCGTKKTYTYTDLTDFFV